MTDLTFYKYKVQWYDTDDNKIHDLCGITIGESYSDAFARVLDYYGGEREVESLYIEAWDVSQCLEMRPEVLRCVEFDEPDSEPDAAAIDKVATTYDNITPLEGKAPHKPFEVILADPNKKVRAYVVGQNYNCTHGRTDEDIINSDWFKQNCEKYGIENIVFEEDLI